MTSFPRNVRLTKGTNVLSWDCGLTNLCYCFLEYVGEEKREFRVLCWENFSLNSQSLRQAVETLVAELDKRPWMMDVDYVCVESQVIRNTQMKVMSHALQTYFVTRAAMKNRLYQQPVSTELGAAARRVPKVKRPTVHFIAAKSKFSVCEVPEPTHLKTRRARNKKVAVLMAEKLLTDQGDLNTLRFLHSFKKKDDLSDSMVQGVYFLRLINEKKKQSNRILRHLGVPEKLPTDDEDDDEEMEISLNEGCETEDEMPLPQVYRSESFILPSYDMDSASIGDSVCYPRTPIQPRWSSSK